MKICYFAPLRSIHTIRWLDYFTTLGHETFAFYGPKEGFARWSSKRAIARMDDPELKKIELNTEYQNEAVSHKRGRFLLGLRTKLYKARELRKEKSWMKSQIKFIQPDIVHALWLGENAYQAWLTGIHPFVITVWGSDIRNFHQLQQGKQNRLRLALNGADAVTSDSLELLSLCQREGVSPDRCHRIGVPGINIDDFVNPKNTGLRNELEIPNGAALILSPRALSPNYQIDKVIDAFEILVQKDENAWLLILDYNANPEYREAIYQKIQSSLWKSRIKISPALPYDRLPELYAISDVMISVPKQDGMPQSIYEAMAAGCPIISSDLTTYDGVIIDGTTGLRVSADDPELLASAIVRLLHDQSLRAMLIANAQSLVRKKGDITQEMDKMEALYTTLLRKIGMQQR